MSTSSPAPSLGQQLWISAVTFGLLAVVLGVVILVWPGKSLLVAAVLFGVYLVVSGLVMVFLAFSLPLAGGGSRFLHFLAGAASIVLGVLAFRHFGEGYAILLLAIWVAVGFIFRGVSSVAAAISHQGFPGRGWAIFFGVLSLIAGLVVLAYPFDSIVTLMLVAGVWLVVLGVAEVIAGITMRRDLSKLEKAQTALVPPGTAAPLA
jgi:uncharacterized membrane protein HdeD (DUF308 family)